MDAEGGSVRQLTDGAAHTQPRWSPRGDVLAYTAREGRFTIWVVNADGSSPRRLTDLGDNQSATWSPDGRHLAFQTSRLGGWQIFAMFPDGSEQNASHSRGSGHESVVVAALAMIRSTATAIIAASQGGPMVTRVVNLFAVSLLVTATVLAGCAKRPALTQASAPPPAIAPAPPPPPPAAARRGERDGARRRSCPRPHRPQPRRPPPRRPRGPPPKEFAVNANVKDIFFDFDRYDVRPEFAKVLDGNAHG